MTQSNLAGQTAIVTGAASPRGIGWATALILASRGANVGVTDLDDAGIEALVREIVDRGGRAFAVRADVSRRDEVETLVRKVETALGATTILVNNAGVTQPVAFSELTDADWDRVLTVNLKSCFLCSQAVLGSMIEQKHGRIICVSSIAARDGASGFGGIHYASSKAGMVGFVRSLAREAAPHNITVNAVAPGSIDTDITKRGGRTRSGLDEQGYEKERIARTPLARLGSPAEVGEAIAFFAGPGTFVTGTVMDVNGGRFIG